MKKLVLASFMFVIDVSFTFVETVQSVIEKMKRFKGQDKFILGIIIATWFLAFTSVCHAAFDAGNFSVGPVGGFEFRYNERPIVDDFGNVVGTRAQFRNVGALTVAVVKYNFTDWFNVFVGYGLAQRKLLEGTQVLVVGCQFDDLVGITLFGGVDLGACAPNGCGSDIKVGGVVWDDASVFGSARNEARWFIAVGWTFNAFSFSLDDTLDGETDRTLFPNR